jgi:hypothetical protein
MSKKNQVNKNFQASMDRQWEEAQASLQGCLWSHPPKESYNEEAPAFPEVEPSGELYL